jgi:hypothetical protein
MTVDRATPKLSPRAPSLMDTLLDGLFTGMIGALAVALWFLILDAAAGRPLYTPALLGGVLLHGSSSVAEQVSIAPTEIAAFTAFHFMAFIAIGIVLSWMMNLFERFPIMFFVLLVLFLTLQIGFFAFDVALGAQLMGRLQPWTVVTANVLAAAAMVLYQWKRHPGVIRGIERLWEHEPQKS